MRRLYIASPLFTPLERSFNATIAEALTIHGDVFLPQRDGNLLSNLLQDGIDTSTARKIVFARDIEAIKNCDIIVAVMDGRTVDEGVSFELGFAFALNKVCLGLKTDDRSMLASGDNPMITEGCLSISKNLTELHEAIESLSCA